MKNSFVNADLILNVLQVCALRLSTPSKLLLETKELCKDSECCKNISEVRLFILYRYLLKENH